MRSILETIPSEHRPWPMPDGAPAISMVWRSLAFLHWRVDPARITPLLPEGLEVETYDGSAWIGVVPFEMYDTRFRGSPRMPSATNFPELNVRTYVVAEGRPGVWFFSLDAASRLAVIGARTTFGLPYFRASMRMEVDGDCVRYSSRRTERRAPQATFRAAYEPRGEPRFAAPATLEHFLTERYCLYAQRRGRLVRGEVHHAPWPLQDAHVELEECDMTRLLGFELKDAPEVVHTTHGVHAFGWWPDVVAL